MNLSTYGEGEFNNTSETLLNFAYIPFENNLQAFCSAMLVCFKRFNKYHDTHEPIFDTYQHFVLFIPTTCYLHKFHGILGILLTKIP